jgi:hypothetical protein
MGYQLLSGEMMTTMSDQARLTAAVLTVGDGRGFVSCIRRQNVVVTAAHCLPRLPEPGRASEIKDRTFANILGRLGEEASVWAECLYADPVADLAVLGPPDGQELWNEHAAYEALVGGGDLPIATVKLSRQKHLGHATEWRGFGELLALDGEWFFAALVAGRAVAGPPWLRVEDMRRPIVEGMSGSPIVVGKRAIGIVTYSIETMDQTNPNLVGLESREPLLCYELPRWML